LSRRLLKTSTNHSAIASFVSKSDTTIKSPYHLFVAGFSRCQSVHKQQLLNLPYSSARQSKLKNLERLRAQHLLVVLKGVTRVHQHQKGFGDPFFVADGVTMKHLPGADIGQDLVIPMRMHRDGMARADPRRVDPADSAVVGGQRKARVEEFNDEPFRQTPRFVPRSSLIG
jgi:hypothetical protein